MESGGSPRRDTLMGARLTALAKPDGVVRGIATGSSVRRLVARTLAKDFASEFEVECALFQHQLSTRAGPDCVGDTRAATDSDPERLESCHVRTIGDLAKGSWHLAFLCASGTPTLPCTIGGMTRVNAQSCRLKEASGATL